MTDIIEQAKATEYQYSQATVLTLTMLLLFSAWCWGPLLRWLNPETKRTVKAILAGSILSTLGVLCIACVLLIQLVL